MRNQLSDFATQKPLLSAAHPSKPFTRATLLDLIYVRRLQEPWIDFVTLKLGAMPTQVLSPSLLSSTRIMCMTILAPTTPIPAGDNDIVAGSACHMMHLMPGGAQYVLWFPQTESQPQATRLRMIWKQYTLLIGGKYFEFHASASQIDEKWWWGWYNRVEVLCTQNWTLLMC